MTTKQKYIELIRKAPLETSVTIQLNNLDNATLVESERGIEVRNELGTQYALEQLELEEILAFCLEINIEPRVDYLIMSDDNQWLSSGKFATQSEIDTEIEQVISDYDEDRPELIIFTSEEMDSFTV